MTYAVGQIYSQAAIDALFNSLNTVQYINVYAANSTYDQLTVTLDATPEPATLLLFGLGLGGGARARKHAHQR